MSKSKEDKRQTRKQRVRKRVKGTTAKPRLCVYRSLNFTYAQLISDENGTVLLAASTRDIDAKDVSLRSVEGAKLLGVKIAQLAKEKNLVDVVFDRNGYAYHGRVAAVAEGAREGGLQF